MKVLRYGLYGLLGVAALGGAALVYSAQSTRAEIDALEERLLAKAEEPAPLATREAATPAPVRRYFEYVFPNGAPETIAESDVVAVEIEMVGDFRRPLTESFGPTTARQVVDVRRPNLVFSADTQVAWPIWAVAYDAFIDGEMEMRARVLSAVTVVEEGSTPALDKTSLRRWLLESPTYPTALLPGGPVRWEPIDDRRARAVVSAHGVEASLVATFRPDGALVRFDAEEDGDLTTPYHGSGEHAARDDYRLVDGVRVPMAFTIARAADGEIHPFWRGRITRIRFRRR